MTAWPYWFLIAGLVCVLAGLGVLFLARRRDDAVRRGIAWQLEKQRRIAAGWRPCLWEADATDEEKLAALMAYLDGEPLPDP